MSAITMRTLLLSQSYEPIRAISWRKALKLLTNGKVEVLTEYDGFLRTSRVVIKIPAVVRLINAFRRTRKPVRFSRINIYARDNYTCQYCGEKKQITELTFDHVLPRSQGGKTTWENIVTACTDCNINLKRDRTPEQAGMKLISTPYRPKWEPSLIVTVATSPVEVDAWRSYCYWTQELSHD